MNTELLSTLLLGSILDITRASWAVKLTNGKWISEAHFVHSFQAGSRRHLDWTLDVVATGEHKRVKELWLFCPPSSLSPMGNTVRIPVLRASSCFTFKIGSITSNMIGNTEKACEALVAGSVVDDAFNCQCFAWDYREQGLYTPETTMYDSVTQRIAVNDDGSVWHPMITNLHSFGLREKMGITVPGMWRESLAPIGALDVAQLGVVACS